mmetsp:Transcript_20177/g.47120  ORF Transcript_20177/g.47120 Transcript_20177/m.47120 type:complete len:272 (+) Transcript_20177:151-966(+)
MTFEHSLGKFGFVLLRHILVHVEVAATQYSTNRSCPASSEVTLFNLPPRIFICFGDGVSKICAVTIESTPTSRATRAQLCHCEASASNCGERLRKARMKKEPLVCLFAKAKVAPVEALADLHRDRSPLLERSLLHRLGAIQPRDLLGNLVDAPQSRVFITDRAHQLVTGRHRSAVFEHATGPISVPSEVAGAFVRFIQQTLEPLEQCFVLDFHEGLFGILDEVVLQLDARHASLQVLGCCLLAAVVGNLQSSLPILGEELDVGFEVFEQPP